MNHRPLGRTGLHVSPLCLGTMNFGWHTGKQDSEAIMDAALDAAHAAKDAWGATSPTERANILLKIADRIEANLEMLAVSETWDNGKPIRETLNADIPLAVDHFRYFAGAIRAQAASAAAHMAGKVSRSRPPSKAGSMMRRWRFHVSPLVRKTELPSSGRSPSPTRSDLGKSMGRVLRTVFTNSG